MALMVLGGAVGFVEGAETAGGDGAGEFSAVAYVVVVVVVVVLVRDGVSTGSVSVCIVSISA